MWFLFLLIGVNACLSNDLVNTAYLRITVNGFPVNIFDMLLIAGLLLTLLPKGKYYYRTERPHPLLVVTMVLFGAAAFGALLGSIGLAAAGNEGRPIVTAARNFICFPLAIIVGYRFLSSMRSGIVYCHLSVWAGLAVTAFILANFGSRSQELGQAGDIVNVRVIDFISNYAGIAGALLLFSLGSGARPLWPKWLAVFVAGVCLIGQFATLSRSDWLALVAGLAAAVYIMPRFRLPAKIGFLLLVTPLLVAMFAGAVYLASEVSGKDVYTKMVQRVQTMLPGEQEGGGHKAWDTRVLGAVEEVKLWTSSPLIGNGFAIQDTQRDNDAYLSHSFRHNTWTSTLAESGVLGFAAFASVCFGLIIVGRRMVRSRLDRTTIMMGGLGVITGVHYIVHAYCTMSFNQVRPGLPLAMTFGALLRVRAMQLSLAKQYEGYLPATEAGQHGTEIAPLLGEGNEWGAPAY